MLQDYSKYLSAKLYMIESISLRGMLDGDDDMKTIHDICIAPPDKLMQLMNDKVSESKNVR